MCSPRGAQLLPLLLLGLQASPAQLWLQFLDRKLKLKRLWPKEALSRSSPTATSFPPIWLQAASTFSRSGALPAEQHDQGWEPAGFAGVHVDVGH